MDNDILLITSVINTGNNPWSYTSIRSVFTMQQRFEQSKQSIQSIRDKMPKGTKIYFAECSEIPEIMETELSQLCDKFFQFKNDEDVSKGCLQSNKKGLGELLKTQKVVEYIVNEKIPFRRLFKLSGRYYLNSSFSETRFSLHTYSFRYPFPNSSCNPTVLYSVPYTKIQDFLVNLYQSQQEFETKNNMMYEIVMPSKMNPKECVQNCGVSGYVAIDGTLYEDN